MSDERPDPAGDERASADRPAPHPSNDRVTGDASTAPAAQPRASDSDTTA